MEYVAFGRIVIIAYLYYSTGDILLLYPRMIGIH